MITWTFSFLLNKKKTTSIIDNLINKKNLMHAFFFIGTLFLSFYELRTRNIYYLLMERTILRIIVHMSIQVLEF